MTLLVLSLPACSKCKTPKCIFFFFIIFFFYFFFISLFSSSNLPNFSQVHFAEPQPQGRLWKEEARSRRVPHCVGHARADRSQDPPARLRNHLSRGEA